MKIDQKGVTLLEAVIALALLGLVAVAYLSGLFTLSKATLTADERATAVSLAQSQMEHVKSQDYITAPVGGEAIYIKIGAPEGYTICSLNRSDVAVENILGVPWNLDPERGDVGPIERDEGFQLIRLVIKHLDKDAFTLDGAKVKR